MMDQGYISAEEREEALADDVYSRIQVADAKNEDNDASPERITSALYASIS